ncbi:esterase [Dyadobacter sp. CY345]|uniref:alpha/beta hydrolase-fold protein n=1 Tax=Dyadobacter sp. CY345 TaxID=2909335 RepID=UPI001EEB9369|nr:alpha/beta hydrolase-fold protein [Dyadobacter sp. CY345]MCF2446916.1 esterase [Dyadobacter sp. CY345]
MAASNAQPPGTPAQTLKYIPFEVNADSSATFRFYAPNAKTVTLGGDLKAVKSERGADSVWTITTSPGLNPSVYRYNFLVDGNKVNDPKNPMVADFRPMVEVVPKNKTLFWQQKEVPHGLLSIVYYPSKATKTTRRMFVWTPPTYFADNKKLPVLYLMHGGGDNDTNWPGQGKAGWILDNLFAEGKIVPMIVVMPDGSIPTETFAEDLGNSIIPFVEHNFRALTDVPHRAIAGLSMGGLETLETILKFPDNFAYVNVMSSGWFANRHGTFEKYDPIVKAAAPTLKKTVKYFIFTTGGASDIADKNNDLTRALFEKYGLKSELSKMEGGHSMYVWRHDLYNFSQKIFK